MNSQVSVDDTSSDCCTEELLFDTANISGSCTSDDTQDFQVNACDSDDGVSLSDQDLVILIPDSKSLLDFGVLVENSASDSESELGYNLDMYFDDQDSDEPFEGFTDYSDECDFLGFESAEPTSVLPIRRKRSYKRRESFSPESVSTPKRSEQQSKTVELTKPTIAKDFLDSPCTTKRRRLKEESPLCELNTRLNKTPIDPDDSIGPYCDSVRCTISWLETGKAMLKPVAINNGMVYEFDEFAKKIAWEAEYVALWIMRLRGITGMKPSMEDMRQIQSVLKRRKAIAITFAGFNTLKRKLLSFDTELFHLHSASTKKQNTVIRSGTSIKPMASPTNCPIGKSLKKKARDVSPLSTDDKISNFKASPAHSLVGSLNDEQLLSFPIGNNYIGDHCRGNNVDICLLNSNRKASHGAVTNGVVYELYHFFIDHGQTLTSLARTLFRLKNVSVEESKISSTLTNLHNLVKKLAEEGVQKNPDLPYQDFDLYNGVAPSTGSCFVPLPFEPKKATMLQAQKTNPKVELSSATTLPVSMSPLQGYTSSTSGNTLHPSEDDKLPHLSKDSPSSTPTPPLKKKRGRPKKRIAIQQSSEKTVDSSLSAIKKVKHQEQPEISQKYCENNESSDEVISKPKPVVTQDGRFDLKQTFGEDGQITRGDIVQLYTQWLKRKMDPACEIFVSDLAKDVANLQKQRHVDNVHIPVGTLMSSSVKLFDQFRQLTQSNKEDAKIYLLEDWMEDVKYLVKPEKGQLADSKVADAAADHSKKSKSKKRQSVSLETPAVSACESIPNGVNKNIIKICDHKITAGEVGPIIKYKVQYEGDLLPCNLWIDEDDISQSTVKSYWKEQEIKGQSSDEDANCEEKPAEVESSIVPEEKKSFKDLYVQSLNPEMVNYQLEIHRDESRRVKVSKREVLEIYNEWRAGNLQRRKEGSRKPVDPEPLRTKVRLLMENKRVRNFNSNCLLDTCYRMYLMCEKLDKEEVQTYLDGDYIELMEASTKHLNCLKEDNIMKTNSKILEIKDKFYESMPAYPEEIQSLEALQRQLAILGAIQLKMNEDCPKTLTKTFLDEASRPQKTEIQPKLDSLSSLGVSDGCMADLIQLAGHH